MSAPLDMFMRLRRLVSPCRVPASDGTYLAAVSSSEVILPRSTVMPSNSEVTLLDIDQPVMRMSALRPNWYFSNHTSPRRAMSRPVTGQAAM
jgi:hypothetical protein